MNSKKKKLFLFLFYLIYYLLQITEVDNILDKIKVKIVHISDQYRRSLLNI